MGHEDRFVPESSLSPDQARHRLYELMRQDLSFEQKAEQVLGLGKRYLDVDNGHLTKIDTDGDIWKAIASTDPGDGSYPSGLLLDLGETYCRHTVQRGETISVHDAEHQDAISDEAFEAQGLHCYHGTPLSLGEETFGTVCFVSDAPRDQPFADHKTMFAELIARMLEHELRRKRTQERLERLEQFASVLSHDLRNPLSVAKGYTEVTLASDALSADDTERLQKTMDSLDRMDDLIDDVLTMARQGREVEETDRVRLTSVAESSWADVATDAGSLTVTDDVSVRADEDRVRRLFENLFRNAVDHGGEGVTVRVGQLSGASGFYVEDDGPGIPEDRQETVFESGVSTEDGGNGLGLAIVESVASAHGWRVRATDSSTGGARFEVSDVIVE